MEYLLQIWRFCSNLKIQMPCVCTWKHYLWHLHGEFDDTGQVSFEAVYLGGNWDCRKWLKHHKQATDTGR
jgi:hypothetical protein